jgi:hypothetical protein
MFELLIFLAIGFLLIGIPIVVMALLIIIARNSKKP